MPPQAQSALIAKYGVHMYNSINFIKKTLLQILSVPLEIEGLSQDDASSEQPQQPPALVEKLGDGIEKGPVLSQPCIPREEDKEKSASNPDGEQPNCSTASDQTSEITETSQIKIEPVAPSPAS